MNVAERAGDFESAGIAALTLIEQLGPTLSGEEVLEAVDRAGTLLDRSEDLSTVKRLARAAFDALFMPQSVTPEAWERFSLPDAIHRYRSRWIRLHWRLRMVRSQRQVSYSESSTIKVLVI